ncbi:hypothetical protein SUDANB2_05263 [Streptomyces sp. enrichment culture]
MNLVIATLENGQAGEAGHLCARVVDSLRRVLGDDHQETRLARELLRDLDEREPRREASAPPVPPQRYWHSYGTSYDGGGGQSDRALKSAVEPVTWRSEPPPGTAAPAPGTVTQAPGTAAPADGYADLRAVAALPVSTWSYRGEEGVRHLGPMAQDWYAALGLGADDRTIHPIDANGVSVVAVQALYRMVSGLQDEVSRLRERLDER